MGEKFQTAEQMMFWAYYTINLQRQRVYPSKAGCGSKYCCEARDVLFLLERVRKEMTERFFDIPISFLPKMRAPNRLLYGEQNAAALWDNLCRRVEIYAKAKGWME